MAVFLKPKQPKQPEAVAGLRSFLDEKAYLEIERAEPSLITIIRDLLRDGHEPADIYRLVMRLAPQRWIEARQVEQAARHLQRGVE